MKIKWLGHASWKIKTGGKTIYIDPYEGEYDEKADLILSTHHHDDHCKVDKIKKVMSVSPQTQPPRPKMNVPTMMAPATPLGASAPRR